ncbi:MAG: LrgB family protein [Clostridiaceae bacterium]
MGNLISTPLFGVMISLVAFEIGLLINKKTRISVLNPLLISILIVIGALLTFDISLDDYNKGGQLISFFLAPSTVVLAVPLYKKFSLLKANAVPIIVGVFTGCIVSITSVILLSKIFGLSKLLEISLVPKSVTTPIGMEISNQLGGISAVTVASIVITGIIGAIIAPIVFKVFRIKDKVAMGVAIGTSAHALGTTKAVEMGEVEGAMSGLAIGVSGLITVIIAPIIIRFFQ